MLELQNKLDINDVSWLATVDASGWNESEKARIIGVTDIASIVMGRLGYKGHNRERLYNRLMTESAGNPSTPFEFVPVMHPIDHYDFQYLRWGVVKRGVEIDFFYTNARNVYSFGNVLFTNEPDEVDEFRVIVGYVPWKVISHLRTHRAFSFLVESSRNKKYLDTVEFWHPDDWNNHTSTIIRNSNVERITTLKNLISLKEIRAEEATMELSDRRMVHFAMAAWEFDDMAWSNLFAVRGAKHTMGITADVVRGIESLIKI